MEREKAIEILEHNWTSLHNPDYTDEELAQALDIAISSLETDEAYQLEYEKPPIIDWNNCHTTETLISLDVYKQVCAERDIAIKQLHELGYEFGQKIQSTTKNDLGVDCISRQAVIELMMQKWGENFSGDDAMQESIDAIRVMPSVTPQEPRKGHWIGIDEEPHEDYECDKCGYTISTYTANIEPHTEYKFCPNCGCRMVEPQKSEG